MKSNPTHINSQNGFTLVELLLVTVLLSLLVGILYGTLNGIFRGQSVIENQQQVSRVAQFALSRMIRELSNYSQLEVLRPETTQARTGLTPFAQQTFRGDTDTENGKPHDSLKFISNGTGQAQFGSAINYGIVEVSYRLEKAPQNDPLYPDSEAFILVREEQPAGVTLPKETIEKRTVRFPLADNIVSLNFRYRNEKKWEDSWSEPSRKGPQAVEISLTLRSEDGKEDTFKTAVALTSP